MYSSLTRATSSPVVDVHSASDPAFVFQKAEYTREPKDILRKIIPNGRLKNVFTQTGSHPLSEFLLNRNMPLYLICNSRWSSWDLLIQEIRKNFYRETQTVAWREPGFYPMYWWMRWRAARRYIVQWRGRFGSQRVGTYSDLVIFVGYRRLNLERDQVKGRDSI